MVSKVFVFVCAMALFVAAASACKCTKIMKKVCGADGNTYNNSCLAKCAGTTASYDGPCRPRSKRNVACTQEYRPVCGTDGVTYGNSCMATAAGVEATDGAC